VFQTPEYVQCLEKVLSRGDNVNARPATTGITCIHTAALNGNEPAIKFCLDHGAFTSCVNTLSMSELHFAILSGFKGVVEQLLRAGSDPSMLIAGEKNCADFAAAIGQTEIEVVLKAAQSSSAESQLNQNVAVVTFTRATDLLAKDDNNLSDPYVTFCHQSGDLIYKDKTPHILETLNPTWDTETSRFYLVIRRNGVYYRNVSVAVWDWDDVESSGQVGVDDLIGRANITLDPRRGDCEQVVSLHDAEGFAGSLYVTIQFVSIPDTDSLLKEQYKKHNPLEETRALLKSLDLKSVGKAKAQLGYQPKYPIMIIPGFASSALECWKGERSAWFRERIWLDPLKVGHTIVGATLKTMMSDSKKLDVNERRWLRHLLPSADGWSDPEGIKLRPVPGLHGTDFLVEAPLAKGASYVNGYVIEQLGHVGYDSSNLDAATYDWRIPPQKLEERDGYFSQLKSRIQYMRESNGERVVLMAHSMGNRCAQYFLSWLEAKYPGWTDDNIHAFLALGPPFLGATKPVRAVISGDCCGLEAFLTLEEGRALHRGLGSVPWLLPLEEEHFPDRIISRVRREDAPVQPKRGLLSSIRGKTSKKQIERDTSLTNMQPTIYDEYLTNAILEKDAPGILQYKQDYYEADPLYLKKTEGQAVPAILRPPRVDNLWVVMGVNLPTEVCYYYKPVTGADGETRLDLDSSADAYSQKKFTGVNPRGFKISGGIGFETKATFQPSVGMNKSGDGTVPYCSLNLAESSWRKYAEQNHLPIKIQTFEIEGAEHREMLNNAAVTNCILDLVCVKPIG